MKPKQYTIPRHLDHLDEGQKLKLISYAFGYETKVLGGEWGTQKMLYTVMPKKKLMYMITRPDAYTNPQETFRLMAYVLNLIHFGNDALNNDYSEEKAANDRKIRDSRNFYLEHIALSLETRQQMNLTPASIVHITESEELRGKSSLEAINNIFSRLVNGVWFLSINSDNETVSISRWYNNAVNVTVYQQNENYRNHNQGYKHLECICYNAWTIDLAKPLTKWQLQQQKLKQYFLRRWRILKPSF